MVYNFWKLFWLSFYNGGDLFFGIIYSLSTSVLFLPQIQKWLNYRKAFEHSVLWRYYIRDTVLLLVLGTLYLNCQQWDVYSSVFHRLDTRTIWYYWLHWTPIQMQWFPVSRFAFPGPCSQMSWLLLHSMKEKLSIKMDENREINDFATPFHTQAIDLFEYLIFK